MKRIHITILCSVFSLMAAAQDFIPLRIDSSYSFFRSIDFVGNPIEVVSFAGYSYNAEDEVQQIRRKNERSSFNYSGFQTVEIVEVFVNGLWEISKRISTTLANEQPVQILTETYQNGFWQNSQLVTINYDNNAQLLLQLTQIWENNGWKNQELIENTYDIAGNRIMQSYSSPNQGGSFVFTFGDRIKFNNNNQPVEILALTGNSTGGVFFSDKFSITYNDDQLQDTVIYCLYNFPDTMNCQNLSRSIFTYDQVGNRVIRNIESWNSDEWVSSGRIEEYAGRNIYSGLPDSILTFDYSLSTVDQLITRQYFEYFDLDNEKVRYEESLFLYQFGIGQFVLENYLEEYYKRGEVVAIDNLIEGIELTLFPNPVAGDQLLTIKNLDPASNDVEIRTFNLMGQLLNQQYIGTSAQFSAPDQPGIYLIEIKNQDKITPLQKIIVH